MKFTQKTAKLIEFALEKEKIPKFSRILCRKIAKFRQGKTLKVNLEFFSRQKRGGDKIIIIKNRQTFYTRFSVLWLNYRGMIKDLVKSLYNWFYSQIWLNLLMDSLHVFYIFFLWMIVTFDFY